MTIVEIELPDQLASEARREGLLSAATLGAWLREQLRAKALLRINANIDAMDEAGTVPEMSEEEIAAEVAAARAERRSRRG